METTIIFGQQEWKLARMHWIFRNNLTIAQIKNHGEKITRKSKTKACLFAAVSPTIFTRIMILGSTKAICDHLKKEYQEDERIEKCE
ncbi:UBN2 domain-containing protein [Gossypium australe]|uniref:UBN2 domain-containing protein n=1 Tax=Gossypium australe TaxID=47621 RepID=A0A5B6W1M7_9ROSI|nr:UBN2 domain-containing protein [Gossypium australe]